MQILLGMSSIFLTTFTFFWICMVFLGVAMRWMVLRKGQPTWLRHFASA
jgi:hypothetical protein